MAVTDIALCSFCLRSSNEVKKMVAGLGVYICNECVGLCSLLVDTPTAAGAPGAVEWAAPWELETDLDQVLGSLSRIAAASDQVGRSLIGWVRKARHLGASWARVGETLGMTRQSAWERFSGEE